MSNMTQTQGISRHDDHDPQHMDSSDYCEHGNFYWRSCRECVRHGCPNPPEGQGVTQ